MLVLDRCDDEWTLVALAEAAGAWVVEILHGEHGGPDYWIRPGYWSVVVD